MSAPRRSVVVGLLAVALAAFAAAAGAPAQAADPRALLRPEAAPFTGPGGQAAWQRFLVQEMHRAFAVSPRGAWGMRIDAPDRATAERDALAACRHYAGEPCALWAVDLARTGEPQPAPPADIAGRFRLSPRHLHFGAEAARGAIVWSHGSYAPGRTAGANRTPVPQPWVRRLNVAGWDVWRFDRAPLVEDMDETLPQLRAGIAALRAAGYRRVIAAGQSRGGWLSLRLLEAADAGVDGVVAVAPARHGTDPELRPRALADFFSLLDRMPRAVPPQPLPAPAPDSLAAAALPVPDSFIPAVLAPAARMPVALLAAARARVAPSPPVAASAPEKPVARPVLPRVALLTFLADPYDPSPGLRARAARDAFASAGLPALVIDRPPGHVGHVAAAEVAFNDSYGGCLAHFFDFAESVPAAPAC